MIKAVIFDMDGTMLNTEGLWKETNYKLAKKYGHKFNEKMRVQMMGRKEEDALQIFKDYYKISASVEELRKIRKNMLFENISSIKINKGLLKLLSIIDKLGLKKAIATSAYKDFVEKALETVGINEKFKVIITGDQVSNGKPNPEIFLKAARELKINPDECLVIEDAQNGVEAAFNAKMKVFAIPHEDSKSHDFSKANKSLKSMNEIDEETLRTL